MKSDENSTPIPQQTVQGNLPSPYADDTVVQAFAGAVDGMLAPVDPVLASMADNYQAFNAPAELLPYLVQVSGARVEPGWPERAVRAAIDLAGWLATHRGTPAGLLTEARIVYGWLLEIDDPGDVHLPGDSTQWPDHTPLYVTMEPRTTGKAPISYDQSTLERLVEAHIPASLTYQIVPSTDHIALYDDPYCTGRAWLVYSDTPDLQVLNADNRASSAWNRTSSVIALYKDTNFLGTNEFIQPNSKADQLNLDNQASSLRFLTNVPADAWGLYDQRGGANGSGQLIGVYHGTRTNLLNTAGGKAVSLVNNTSHTLQLFNADRSTFQMVYPGLTADLLDINLVHALDSVVDHATVPNGAYCLYEEVQQGGKSWLFWDDSDQPIDLTDPQIAAHPVCSVYNNTTRTLQLLNHTGDDQLFYPQAYNSVSTALNQTTTTATLYDGPPDRCFCLYEGPAQTGRQWVFKDTEALTHLDNPTINAANAISSVDNKTIYTLELFQNHDGTGTSQLIYPTTTANITTTGLDNTANSVKLYHGPPNNYFCLYEGDPDDPRYRQWVFKDTAVLTDLTDTALFADASRQLSSARNLTLYTLELFQNHDGTGLSQLIYPGTDNIFGRQTPALNDQVKSVRVHNGPPTNYFAFYDGAAQTGKQWVFKDTAGLTNLTDPVVSAGDLVSSVKNLTQYTLELFQHPGGGGTGQLFYPGVAADANPSLNNQASSVNVYHGPPTNYFALYEHGKQGGRQWVFKDTAGLTDLTNTTGVAYGDVPRVVSSVNNQTMYTLELFQNNNGTGTSQLIYPGTTPDITTPDLNDRVTSVNVYHSPPADHFCLYENPDQSGTQWVFNDAAGLTDLTSANLGRPSQVASSIKNLTKYTLELFQWSGGTGTSQLVYPSTTTNYIAALDNAVNGVKLYHGPPNNYFCLYEGDPDDPRYRQWVFKDTAVLTDLTDTALFADASRQLSSARNLTLYTLELFQNHDGTGLSQLIYPGTDNIFGRQTPALNDQVKSVRVHNGPPTNYFALYEAASFNAPPFQNYRQWVFKDTDGLIDITGAYYGTGTNKGISSVDNKTMYTLELFQNNNGTGSGLLVYPGTTKTNLADDGFNDQTSSVYLYRNPRPGYFSLYEQRIPNQNTMRQWTFKDTAVLTDLTNTTLYGDIALRISTVNNQTNYTLELFKNNDGTGTSQLYYPATTVAVPPGSLEDQVKSVKVYNGPPANCFCLYGDGNYGGAQWVFKNAVGHVDLTNTSRYGVASGAISSARNNSTNAIEVFDQPSEHGKLQLIPPSGSISSVFGHLNDRIKSFTVYGALQFPTPCVVANKRSWKVVDVNNSSTTVGLTLQQWVHLGYNNQRWIIVPAGGGASRFHNVNSLLAMGVQGNSTSDSAKTTQEYPDADNPSQKWKIGSWDSYWLITNVRSNKVLDVSGGSTSNGAPVIQYKINWHDNQAWEFLVPRNP